MSTVTIPVNAIADRSALRVAVSAAYDSSGDALAYTTATTEVIVANLGAWAVEYRLGSDAWKRVEPSRDATLNTNLATTELRFRAAQFAGACLVELRITGSPGALEAGDDAVPVSGAAVKTSNPSDLLVPGDSIELGQAVSVVGNRYSSLLAAKFGLTERNIAIAGSIIERWIDTQIGNAPITSNTVSIVKPGFNNARYAGANSDFLSNFGAVLGAILCYLATPDASRVFGQVAGQGYNPAITFGGTWPTSATWQAQATSSLLGVYSSTVGAYVEGYVTGDTVHIFLGGRADIAASAAVSVKIDGVDLGGGGTVSPAPVAAPCDGAGAAWQPFCLRIPGLSNTRHLVRVTIQSAVPTLFGYMAGLDTSAANALPTVYVSLPPRITAAGWEVSPSNGSDAVLRSYHDAIRREVRAAASEGMRVQLLDDDTNWVPSPGAIADDLVHPKDIYHAIKAQAHSREFGRSVLFTI